MLTFYNLIQRLLKFVQNSSHHSLAIEDGIPDGTGSLFYIIMIIRYIIIDYNHQQINYIASKIQQRFGKLGITYFT